MTQYVINIGAIPNDGTGDPLRTAFNETNLNFNQVFAAGPVLSNIQIANNKILTTNTNGNLVLAPNGTGVIQANVSIVPNLANLRNLGSATNRWSTVYTQYLNATQINLTGDLTVAGNLTVQGNIIQIGNIVTDSLTIQLANTASTANAANGAGITVGANDNIATVLYNSTGNVWNMNIGLSTVGNITAPYFFGNGSQLTGLAAPYGNANVANYLPTFTGNIATGNLTANTVTVNGNLWAFTTIGAAAGGSYLYSPTGASWYADPNFEDDFIYSGPGGYINIGTLHANSAYASQIHLEQDTTQIIMGSTGAQQIWAFDDFGNLTLPGNTFAVNYANGNPVSLDGNYSNANVATFLAAFGNNTVSTTGNITSNYYVGNVAVLAGQNIRGEHAANLGASGFTELNSNVILQITGNANSYAQINFQNISNGTAATTDYIATAQFGTDSTYFVDMGIASGTYDSSNPDNSLGNSLYAQDSYVYAMGGNSYGGSGGNLVVGSNEPGGVVRIIADGSTTNNIVATFSNVGISTAGNIFATGNITSNGLVNVNSLRVNQTANAWNIAGNTITAPSGATWNSNAISKDEYITSAVDGYINLTSLYANGNTASQVHLEHGLAQIVVDNGTENIWVFDATGNLTLPGNASSINYANGTNIFSTIAVYGNANVAQYLPVYSGNILANYYFGNVAEIIGQNTRGEHAANLGAPGFTELNANVILQVTGNANSYTQVNFQNINSGNRATTDFIATSAFGTDSTFFVDMGIASNSYDQNSPDNSLGTSLYPQDSYLYSQGGNSYGGSGGNLVVGSNEPGGVVRIIADGSDISNIVATFSNVGVDVKGNIVPVTSNVYSLGNSTNQWSDLYVSNATIYMNNVPISLTVGNVLTVNGEAVLTNDSDTTISTTGNVTGNNLIATGNIVLTGSLVGSGASPAPSLSGFSSVSAITVSATGNVTGNTAGFAIGYRDIPQIAFTGNATIATADAGKHFYSTQSTDYVLTIANNASQGFQTGAAITIVNQGTGNITVAQGSGVILYLAGNVTSGNRTVTTFGMATIMKVATDTWFINGTGVS